MRNALLVLGAVTTLASNVAQAAVYFDSIDVTNPTYGMDGAFNHAIAMADSFNAGTPNFSQISLQLSAVTPSDGGSALVYLVPNTGGSAGVAGSPSVTLSAGNFVSFSGADLIGSIADSSLATTGVGTSLVTFNFSPTLGASLGTTNAEYWIGLVPGGSSSIQWYYGAASNGVGETNQSNFYATSAGAGGGTGIVADAGVADTSAPYDLIVNTPEPASLAILGGALAGLGYFRRRGGKKA